MKRLAHLFLAWALVFGQLAGIVAPVHAAVSADTSKTGFAQANPQMLRTLGAAVTGVAAAETIVMQTLLAPGQWQTNGAIRVRLTGDKSGATDSYLVTVRVGTAGTTADTAITGLSARGVMAAGSRSGGWEFDIILASATSAQFTGNASPATSSYGGSSSTVASAATTITSAAANALWVSVAVYSSGAADTVTIRSGSIQLVAP